MAKKGIHPDYHPVTLKTFNKDGSELVFQTKSTIKGDELVSEVNIFNHPAWKDNATVDTENSVNKIMNKFTSKYKYKVS